MLSKKGPIRGVLNWVRRQPPKVKAFLAVLAVMTVLMLLRAMFTITTTSLLPPRQSTPSEYRFSSTSSRWKKPALVLDSRGGLLVALGYGLWPPMALLSEIVQTFILADFCYYYVKSVFGGQLVLRLPSGVV